MTAFPEQLRALAGADQTVGIVVVDHGSRREQSNTLLEDVAALFQRTSAAQIVEPAHMELAEPSIATAFGRCVERGAELVVVFPYFLAPGRHWSSDIPRLAAEAAAQHPEVKHLVTAPLGLHEALATIIRERIEHCLTRAFQDGPGCAMCEAGGGCVLHATQ